MDPSGDAQNSNNPSTAAMRGRIPSPPYGYHNSFHTHAIEANLPSYSEAKTYSSAHNLETDDKDEIPILPLYHCTISIEAAVYLRFEFLDPFTECPDSRWRFHYAVLHGTKLSFYTLKSNHSPSRATQRKPLHCFSLQHAEIGMAVDLPPQNPVPKCPLLDALPSSMRLRLLAAKPSYFGPKHEWILRLRLENYQILLSFDSQFAMLDWVENLCAAIDISLPLEDRTYPRYRSLPRRTRRQRQLESSYQGEAAYQLLGLESLGQRLIEQQQQIINSLYPNLGSDPSAQLSTTYSIQPTTTINTITTANQLQVLERVLSRDPDIDDLDPADIRESPYLHDDPVDHDAANDEELDESSSSLSKPAFRSGSTALSAPSTTSMIRYRRRCAPIMNRYSPRSSDVILCRGMRVRIDPKHERLLPFELAPPKYPKVPKNGSRLPVVTEASVFSYMTASTEGDIENQRFQAQNTHSAMNPTSHNHNDLEITRLEMTSSLPRNFTNLAQSCVVNSNTVQSNHPRSSSSSSSSSSSLSSSDGQDAEISSLRSLAALTIASSAEAPDHITRISTGASSLLHDRIQDDQIIEDLAGNDELVSPLKEKQSSKTIVQGARAGFISLVI